MEERTGTRGGNGKRKRPEGQNDRDDGGQGRAAKASASVVVEQTLVAPALSGEPGSASTVVVTAVDFSAVEAQRGGQQGTYALGVEAVQVTSGAATAAAASPIHASSSASEGDARVSVRMERVAPGAGQISRLVDAAVGLDSLETAIAAARARAANAAEARAALAATGGGGGALGDGAGSVGPASISM